MPMPRLTALFEVLQALAVACLLAAAIAAAASLTLRWRRADRTRRQQLKWFLAVLPLVAVTIFATVILRGPWSVGFGVVAGTLLPVAIGVAVLRYGLYEIETLLNRAVLYGLLTAGVAGIYLAVVAVARTLFGVQGRGLVVQVVATVLAAAALASAARHAATTGEPAVLRRPWRTLRGTGQARPPHGGFGRRQTWLNSVVKTIADSLRLPYVALELGSAKGGARQPPTVRPRLMWPRSR